MQQGDSFSWGGVRLKRAFVVARGPPAQQEAGLQGQRSNAGQRTEGRLCHRTRRSSVGFERDGKQGGRREGQRQRERDGGGRKERGRNDNSRSSHTFLFALAPRLHGGYANTPSLTVCEGVCCRAVFDRRTRVGTSPLLSLASPQLIWILEVILKHARSHGRAREATAPHVHKLWLPHDWLWITSCFGPSPWRAGKLASLLLRLALTSSARDL